MGNESRYDQYDLNIVLPEPLVPRHLRLPVPERLDNDGQRAAAARRAPRCARWCRCCDARRSKASPSACCTPSSTRRTSAACATSWPRNCRTSRCRCQSEVSPEMREWERFSTTVANAYVQPLMARYLRRLADGSARRRRRRAAVPDDVGRRPDHDRDRLPLPDPPGGKRSGGRRDLLRPHRAANAASTACCRSTWAARRRRSA